MTSTAAVEAVTTSPTFGRSFPYFTTVSACFDDRTGVRCWGLDDLWAALDKLCEADPSTLADEEAIIALHRG
ncbi:MAG: hypothetical protein ACRDY5_06555, partial [Acidimicrobiales bacterium]